MGLFDIFKKKKTELQENELEKFLRQATSNFSAQKEFYQKLLENQLFIVTSKNSISEIGRKTEKENTTVQCFTFESGQIPIFTSVNRIFEKGIMEKNVPYLSLKGQDLFEVLNGATFVLNPFSDFVKELIPQEIENLLNGTIYNRIDKQEFENKKIQEFNEIFEQAGKKQEGLVILDGYRRKELNKFEKLKLEESIQDFQKCLDIVPEHWQSMVLMSKAFQRLERHHEALEQLELAFKLELENHIIPMEASLEAMHLKDIDKAIFYSEESLKRKPNDYTLLGNHAMNLLVARKDNEAKETIDKAIKIQPNDSINKNIESIIKDVIAEKRQRPTFEDAVK
ncbi:enhanced serine sensitivity protein SseB [Flavobacterium anhuiense]|uniref:Enhanced serine sensitivity protein SseB n=1 Tax=Flavobacterium anhuiense TaxID=459526 RepID=A0AAC9CX70_9FLAO|nr:SseB family protein [Flavobacterium anhuiense]AOC93667.1 enhanced serine sensitivity protein SseB [Flavobacterium anhuiense]